MTNFDILDYFDSHRLHLFWIKVQPPSFIGECWQWTGSKNKYGYGTFNTRVKTFFAHRAVYQFLIGKIPKGLELDHLCKNRSCVNPYHLEAVTHRTNIMRGDSPHAKNSRHTHCPKGHLLEGSNLLKYRLKDGHRVCRECFLIKNRNRMREKRSKISLNLI